MPSSVLLIRPDLTPGLTDEEHTSSFLLIKHYTLSLWQPSRRKRDKWGEATGCRKGEKARGEGFHFTGTFNVEVNMVETSWFFSASVQPVLHIRAIKWWSAQLQICCHCRNNIWYYVGWSKQLWVRRWLTEITPKIARPRLESLNSSNMGFYLICWVWNTALPPIHRICAEIQMLLFISHLYCITSFTKTSCGKRLEDVAIPQTQ